MKQTLLEEKKDLNIVEIEEKIRRLDGYIAKTKHRIAMHEKQLEKIREINQKNLFKVKKGIIRGKIYG